jgi:hemoglobin-like flavoprotein
MDPKVLERFDESLRRCNSNPEFLDRFYDKFLTSSPKVRQKFTHTDFGRQKRALRASLNLMPLAASDPENGPSRYLKDLAAQHSKTQLNIGAELYDLWLDSLLEAVREIDPECNAEVEAAWEEVMMVGIQYMLKKY